MRRFLGKWFYNFSWLVCRGIFPLMLHYQVKNKDRLKDLSPRLIIVANHCSTLDPHLIGAAFPFNSKVFPICFATAPKYYRSPVLFPFIWLYNGFPIYRKIGLDNALKIPLKILQKGGAVGIFPEGKVRHKGRPRKARRGAAYLALKTGAPIMPIRIEGILNITLKELFLRKRRAVIIAGEKFHLPKEIQQSQDINQTTNLIADKLLELKI